MNPPNAGLNITARAARPETGVGGMVQHTAGAAKEVPLLPWLPYTPKALYLSVPDLFLF